jgi:hypothetical protein
MKLERSIDRLICPTGKSATARAFDCPVPFAKIFLFSRTPNQIYIPCHPVPLEGRIAIVTDVGHGMRWTRQRADVRCWLRTAKSCGPDASTPASSLRVTASDGDKKARSPGRARNKPLKPLRAGTPVNRSIRGDYARVLCFISHARLRVHRAPGVPHALTWVKNSCTTRAPRAAGMRARVRHCERSEAIHGCKERMDCFVASLLAMTPLMSLAV